MTEIGFKVFETCFEIWFVVEPGNSYIVSLPSESATDKKCQLVHEKNGIRTTIKTF